MKTFKTANGHEFVKARIGQLPSYKWYRCKKCGAEIMVKTSMVDTMDMLDFMTEDKPCPIITNEKIVSAHRQL